MIFVGAQSINSRAIFANKKKLRMNFCGGGGGGAKNVWVARTPPPP